VTAALEIAWCVLALAMFVNAWKGMRALFDDQVRLPARQVPRWVYRFLADFDLQRGAPPTDGSRICRGCASEEPAFCVCPVFDPEPAR
jgi:hypothetical protein